MAVERQIKELVLVQGQYAYIQDLTTGNVKAVTGPSVINQSQQERPMVFDLNKKVLVPVESLSDAVRQNPIAVEGYYLVLYNPPLSSGENPKPLRDLQPNDGVTAKSPTLDLGKRVHIPGPATFPLWPGQMAEYIRGHHLRLNQYLKVQVYNEEQAIKNWKNAVVQSATGEQTELTKPQSLTVGTTLLVKGTDVRFYIPPTGIKVVERADDEADMESTNTDKYVRDALTLERLEYAILVNETGNKRYAKGPAVVFPEPTERFISKTDKEGRVTRRFRAIELTEIQGIHLKAIAPYKDGDREYKEGEELFVTGKETQIYYPREEHALIQYDGQPKHFATCIPAGEARYVLNRMTGEIRMVKGPEMYLPDPRIEVFVRRALSDDECALWFPNNAEALEYNRSLRAMASKAPTTRSGVVSDGEFERAAAAATRSATRGGAPAATLEKAALLNSNMNAVYAMDSASIGQAKASMVADEFSRGSTYTDPRTLTLNTKFQGVPTINLWPGYAVTVVRRGGGEKGRRTIVGPDTVHLAYDETLEVLSLSTGKPKTTDKLLRTVYLKAQANKVSDLVVVETADHVNVIIKLAYEINFEGDPNNWSKVENYVKYATDRARSVLKGAVHQVPIAKFYANHTDIVRNIILMGHGEEPGYRFEENGMRIVDVDVFEVVIQNPTVKALLDDQQARVIKSNIDVANTETDRATTERLELLRREISSIKLTSIQQNLLREAQELAARHELELGKIAANLDQQKKNREQQEFAEATRDFMHKAELERQRLSLEAEMKAAQSRLDLDKAELEAKTKAIVETFGAVGENLTQAVAALTNNETAVQMAKALSLQNALGGGNLVETVQNMLRGTPMANIVQQTLAKLPANGASNGAPRA